MGKQKERIAYGRPDFGGIVIGGENNTRFTLGDDWIDDFDGDKITVATSFWVHGTASEIEERVASLKALVQDLGNLGITGADLTTFQGDLSLSARDVVLDVPSAPFTEEMIGLPVDVEGVGSFQITEFVNTTQVKCLQPQPLALPASASTLNMTVGIIFRHHNEVKKTGGINGRGRVTHVPSIDNEPGRRRFNLLLTFTAPAEDFRGDGNNRQKGRIQFRDPAGCPRAALFTGSYTAADAAQALTIFNAEVTSYVAANMLALLGTGVSWEKVGDDILDFDDNKNELNFTLIRQEIPVAQSVDDFDHSAISNANITINVTQDYQHGLSGITPPSIVNVGYTCVLVRGQFKNEDIDELWNETVYPHLVGLVESFEKSTVVVFQNEHSYQPTTCRLSGVVRAVLTDTGDSIINYQRTVNYALGRRKTFRDVWDGVDYSLIESSPGPIILAVVSVRYTEIQVSKRKSQGIGIFGQGTAGQLASGGGSSGLFGIGASLQISIDDSSVENSEDEGNLQFKPLREPQKPAEFFKSFGITVPVEGEWREKDLNIQVSPRSQGNDPLGISTEANIVDTTITRVWRWANLKGVSAKSGVRSSTGGPSLSLPSPDADTVER